MADTFTYDLALISKAYDMWKASGYTKLPTPEDVKKEIANGQE